MSVAEVDFPEAFHVSASSATPDVLIVCEHASNHIPDALDQLGLSATVTKSHVAWDPGALGVAQELRKAFDSVLVEGAVSRLVYDCNRPPEAESAIPEQSEVFEIPGNRALNPADRQARVSRVYEPFTKALEDQITAHRDTLELMVTVHSFTPVFHGVTRDVEIGILHGRDTAFAHRMMATAPVDGAFEVRLNEPYAAVDGVAHTLDKHGAANNLPSVMIEIRNDLIATSEQQENLAGYLSAWIKTALDNHNTGKRSS